MTDPTVAHRCDNCGHLNQDVEPDQMSYVTCAFCQHTFRVEVPKDDTPTEGER